MGWLEQLETKDFTVNRLGTEEDGFTPSDFRSVGRLPRTSYGYAREVGQGLDSNVVMSPIGWIMRNFTEAEPVVEQRNGRAWEYSEDHALELLMARPNPFYGNDLLWKATILSHRIDGNAYWQKVRNDIGGIIGLWYLPHFLVEPKWPADGSLFISHYEYRPDFGGSPITLLPRDVVHLRDGLDPRNVRKGMSPVKPLLREVFTDEEAANFSASILRNMGVPGGIIAPKDDKAKPSPAEVEKMKEYMKTGFTGDKRGEWLVLGTPTELQQFGFDPQALMLGNLRDIAEERVCAALGVPAAVVGFGSGLQSTKVGATMKELRKEAWDSCIRPLQTSTGKQTGDQLLPDFVSKPSQFRVRWDTTQFAASQEDETEKATRNALLVEKGILRVDRAQAALGLEVDHSRAVYLGPPVANTDEPPPLIPNGNGKPGDLASLNNRAQKALIRNGGS